MTNVAVILQSPNVARSLFFPLSSYELYRAHLQSPRIITSVPGIISYLLSSILDNNNDSVRIERLSCSIFYRH